MKYPSILVILLLFSSYIHSQSLVLDLLLEHYLDSHILLLLDNHSHNHFQDFLNLYDWFFCQFFLLFLKFPQYSLLSYQIYYTSNLYQIILSIIFDKTMTIYLKSTDNNTLVFQALTLLV